MRTVPVQIVCRKCAHPYRTTVRGGNTRCAKCRTSRHVRIDQEWEGPVSPELSGAASRALQVGARPPAWCECSRCGHEWQSRARDRMTIHCPECGTGQRVPYRTYENTGPVPERRRPTPRPSRPRPEPYRRADRAPVDPWEDERPEPAPVRPSVALAGFLAALQARSRPAAAPAAPRPAAPAVVPRSAPAPAPRRPSVPVPAATPRGGVAPVDVDSLPLREQVRRDRMSQVVRSLSSHLMVWYDAPARLCEVLDTTLPRDRRRCPGTVTHGVTFFQGDGTDVTAYTCTAHAGPLAATALRSPYVRASPYRIR